MPSTDVWYGWFGGGIISQVNKNDGTFDGLRARRAGRFVIGELRCGTTKGGIAPGPSNFRCRRDFGCKAHSPLDAVTELCRNPDRRPLDAERRGSARPES